jgi:hypothetical protein
VPQLISVRLNRMVRIGKNARRTVAKTLVTTERMRMYRILTYNCFSRNLSDLDFGFFKLCPEPVRGSVDRTGWFGGSVVGAVDYCNLDE